MRNTKVLAFATPPPLSSSSSEVSESASVPASGTSTPTSSTTSSLLPHDLNNNNPFSRILVLYHKATSTLLLRQLAIAYSTCVEALELLATTNKAYGLDQVTESLSTRRSYFLLKQKLWILNITVFEAMLSDRVEVKHDIASRGRAGLRRRLLGTSKENPEKLIKDLWRRVMEDYGGLEGDVDGQVMVAFTLLCINQKLHMLAREATEAYLATIPEGMLIHLEAASGALTVVQRGIKDPLMVQYERLIELYVVHVLSKLHEWEYARQFLESNSVLSDSTKQMYITILNRLQKKSTRPKKAVVKGHTAAALNSSTSSTSSVATRSTSVSSMASTSSSVDLGSVKTSILSPVTTSKMGSTLPNKEVNSPGSLTKVHSRGPPSKEGVSVGPIQSRTIMGEVSASTFQGRFWILLQHYVDQVRSARSRIGANQMMVIVGIVVFLSTLSQSRLRASNAMQIVVEKLMQRRLVGEHRLLLNGILDRIHFVFFELIFVLAFQKLFGISDLSERLFPAQIPIRSGEAVLPVKTVAVTASGAEGGPKKKVKKVVRKTSSTGTVAKKPKERPYAKELADMEKKFTDYLERTEIWEKIYEEDDRGKIEVYQYKARPMCYKVIAVMDSTPETTFDLLCDVARRVEWDPLCVEAKTVANVAPGIKIQYVRTKAMWPTSSRDTLVLGTAKKLADGRYMNVTSSVEHPLMPERTKESIVRMDTALAGQIVGPEPGQPDKSRLVQVLDTDLKGWIPDKIIQLVSTKAVPGGIRKVNKILRSTQPYNESITMENYAKALKAAEEAAEQGEDAESGNAGGETSHEQASKSNPALTTSTSPVPDPATSAIGRKRPSTFGIFWEGFKQNLGYGPTPGKPNKALVAALVIVVLGPAFARFRRSRK
ncbi:hypothetical protein BGX21_008436 [Mortierella sp. AD011]|nr:hypothetical protein BGX20_005542 [Mortierella sp. AD010]KAF9403870.1 hypothetical protein BGX21_008436 [Mortierella sp. AD011]